MGVCASAITYVGIYTDNAEQYLINLGLLKEDQLDEEFDGDWEYALQQLGINLEVKEVSMYSDEGQYVGYEVSPTDYKLFDSLMEKFKNITGDVAEVHSFTHWW